MSDAGPVVFTARVARGHGICQNDTWISGCASRPGPSLTTSAWIPTISHGTGSGRGPVPLTNGANMTRWPIGSTSARYRLTKAWLTVATRVLPARSSSVSGRPRTVAMPKVR